MTIDTAWLQDVLRAGWFVVAQAVLITFRRLGRPADVR